MKEILKGFIFYFINHILNKIPSRRIRIFFYNKLSKGKISKKASIGLGVKILDIRNIKIGDYANINFDSILDGRGDGIVIGKNVDIAPQVNIWSLEHNPNSNSHESRSGKVIIEDNCWIANRVTILPFTHIESNCVIGAASIVKGNYKKNSISMCKKAKQTKIRSTYKTIKLTSIRIFR
jgi:acetyltransferase-like isoleucine patch superfamily enzyme